MYRLPHSFFLFLLTACLLAPVAQAERAVDQTHPANGDAIVSVENLAGSIKVEGWNRDQVQITGTLGEDVEELVVDASGDRVEIEVKLPQGRNQRMNDAKADLTIQVPRGATLRVETVSAGIEARELGGALELESVSGDIEVVVDATNVRISSVSGNVNFEGRSPAVEIEVVSGKTSVHGVEENLTVQSVSGMIEVMATNLRRAELASVSGNLIFNGDLAADGHLEVENHSGVVELNLPAGIGADIEVETFSGNILNDLSSDKPERTNRYTPGQELAFALNGGGAEIEVSSFSGTIKLQQR